jgi:N-acyl homoserine lactone hydrolase
VSLALSLDYSNAASLADPHPLLAPVGAVYVQGCELEVIRAELERFRVSGKKTAYIPGDFKRIDELVFKSMARDGVCDVFGDLSVVLFPSPGHTAGHQSLMVKSGGKGASLCLRLARRNSSSRCALASWALLLRSPSPPIPAVYVLTADADYTLENLDEGIAPGLAWDMPHALQSLRMFKVLRNSDPEHVIIVPSHDPAFWADKPMGEMEVTDRAKGAASRSRESSD